MKGKYSRFFAILRSINATGVHLTKEDAVSDFTDKRTTSLTDLSDQELTLLESRLQVLYQPFRHRLVADHIGDRLRKRIIAIYKSIGQSTAYAKAWAEKNGVNGHKKKFNDYTHQELKVLGDVAEKIKVHHIASVTKK